MTHRPRKRFGQNFLQDQHVIDDIFSALHVQARDHVVEIGPGLGALTKPLLESLDHLTAIEIDTDLYEPLHQLPHAKERLHLIQADALMMDCRSLGTSLRLVGNLPYNISTPLLIHLLQQMDVIQDMHFMLQKEVVERLAAPPGSKTYGRLSVMAQYYCEVEHLFDVAPHAFYPQPKVESAIVRFTPWQNKPYPCVDFSDLEALVGRAFSMRRKTLTNNLKGLCSVTELTELGLNPSSRPEQLSVEDFVRLTKYIKEK